MPFLRLFERLLDPLEWLTSRYVGSRCGFRCPLTCMLGFYEPIRHNVNKLLGFSPTEQRPYTSIVSGAASGVIGGMQPICVCTARVRADLLLACLGNPLFLIKARLQVSYKPINEMDTVTQCNTVRRILPLFPSAHNTTTKAHGTHSLPSSGKRDREGLCAELMRPCFVLQWAPLYVQD